MEKLKKVRQHWSGKTRMVKAFAESFKGEFERMQFTLDVLPSDETEHPFF